MNPKKLANGSKKPHKWSDIDLIIVSPKFRKLDFIERGARMYDYWNLNYPADFLCFTPEEFKERAKKISIVSEAIKNGIEVKDAA
ncbi:MAG: nucleotidyltransferase domain-containing protein [Nanoarchaeota archaeon]|nr:nucleotidyltransferase domain-containing protein [Nanoarchaeota archaeon]MBU4299719.1 nucleotidyltransferase domain-containing protein [Nanoarchaeota archaeon]MBU4451440.1 nucleotidyltransferase domain-containing protein [Nanoarchaeota archaeon]MCG2723792.1 nucleotidyltransferase domain-containing protein [archaeon]